MSQASPACFSDASHKYIREAFIVKFINTCDLVFRVHNGCVADHMRVLCTRRMVRVAKATTVYQFERDSGLKSGTLDMLARARDISASEVKEVLGAGAEDWARHVRVETRRGVATFVGQMAMVLTTAADLTMLTFREVSGPGPSGGHPPGKMQSLKSPSWILPCSSCSSAVLRQGTLLCTAPWAP